MVFLRADMCPGLDSDLVRDLRAADVKTVEDLVSSNLEDLAHRCSVSYKALYAIRRVLLAQHSAFPVSGADLYEELLSSTAIISTGNPSLDKLLDSGLYTGEITELSGGPGSGKSQVCFGVAVHVSLQLKQNVIYVDTTGGLSASRLLQMLRAQTCNVEEQMEALQRIRVCRLFDIFALLHCLHTLCSDSSSSSSVEGGAVAAAVAAGGGGVEGVSLQQASVSGGSVKAVIVDSVSAVISPLLGGNHTEAMSLMIQVAGILRTMAKDFNVAVLVTNHVTRNTSSSRSCGTDVQPGLGVSWSHIPRTRVLLERVEEAGTGIQPSVRSATLIKSSRQPCFLREEFDLRFWSQTKTSTSGKRKREESDS
ncbi:DNA repair protein RAD51 homolog 4 isoform X2 [Cynoglossus semilaevis]|uniref:RAD51 paralog D n=1 Tax=Cynoglossus semilaevis TaxID=244447 RepID=A0A3P8W612_CYNSE|nr:DNA repair protein RAD51 homolog 4 isoform X2 [Cynoglossus semilaevis]